MIKKIHIFATTDVHGNLYQEKINDGLFGKLSNLAHFLKNVDDDYLLIDNGDWFLGNSFTTFLANSVPPTKNPLTAALNQLGYQAVVCGNHDLDYGLSYLKKVTANFNGDVLSANLVDKNLEPIFKPYTIIEKSGIKVAILGLTTAALRKIQYYENVAEIYCLNTLETVKKYLPELEEKADIIIVSYHGGIERNMETGAMTQYDTGEDEAYKILSTFPQIDGFICGHQHFINQGISTARPFIQPGTSGNFLGELIFEVDTVSKKILNFSTKLNKLDEIISEAPFSQEFLPYINQYESWLTYTFDESLLLSFIHKTIQRLSGVNISCFKKLTTYSVENILAAFKPPYTLRCVRLSLAELEHFLNKNRSTYSSFDFDNIEFSVVDDQIRVVAPKLEEYSIVVNSECDLFPEYCVARVQIDNVFDQIIKYYKN